MRRLFTWTLLGLCAAGVGCTKHDAQPAATRAAGASGPAVPVTVATAAKQDVPVEINAIGTVQPLQIVTIKSQVPGQLAEVHFHEGDEVKQGDLLFTIDPRPFEIALQQAQAQLASDTTMARDAQELADRLTGAGSAVMERDIEAAKNKADALQAALQADQAAIENAKLRLSYTKINAPITGRTGRLMVDRGNIIKENDTELMTIAQIEPIYVAFSVPESSLNDIQTHMRGGELKVSVSPPGAAAAQTQRAAVGSLTFIDNNVDRTTGTVLLKATFPNADRRLWPGGFVNTVLRLKTRHDVVVIATAAVQTGQSGQHVFIVSADNRAELRPVVAGAQIGDQTVIESGLSGGERVVTDGQMRLVSGAAVAIKQAPKTTNDERQTTSQSRKVEKSKGEMAKASTSRPNFSPFDFSTCRISARGAAA